MKQEIPSILMGVFIAGVIVAGLFGPYMISILMAVLVAACVVRFA